MIVHKTLFVAEMEAWNVQGLILLALVFLAGIVVFIFQNNSVVTVHFLSWVSPDISLAIVVLIAAGTGALITVLLNGVRFFKLAKRIRELAIENKELQKELDNAKAVIAKPKAETKDEEVNGDDLS